MVWYSSEVTGTIIVQCIPMIRPLFRDIRTSLTSRQLADSDNQRASSYALSKAGKNSARRSGRISKLFAQNQAAGGRRAVGGADLDMLDDDIELADEHYHDKHGGGKRPDSDQIALDELGLPAMQSRFRNSMTPSELERIIAESHTAPLAGAAAGAAGSAQSEKQQQQQTTATPSSPKSSRPQQQHPLDNWPLGGVGGSGSITGAGGGGVTWGDRGRDGSRNPRDNRIDPDQWQR
jgi:hypothetical protein